MEEAEQYRCRLVKLQPDDNPDFQAAAACEILADLDGILLAAPFSLHSIHIIYALDKLTYEIIIELLRELHFSPAESILVNLRNSIYGYLDENARSNLHLDISEFQQEEEMPDAPDDSEKYWEDYR